MDDAGSTALLVTQTLPGPGGTPIATGTLDANVTATSIGLYYEAVDRDTNTDALPAVPVIVGSPTTTPSVLDAYDRVQVNNATGKPAKGVEIFEITDSAGNTGYARLEGTSTDATPSTARFYQMVDIIANTSKADGADADGAADNLSPVTVSLPVIEDYEHIHFGVWAALGAAKTPPPSPTRPVGSQQLTNLGIGFVQNFDDSGMTEKQGIGTATFNGDWVAAVRRQYASDAEAGAIALHSNSAVLTADFGTGKFKGVLTGLATLEGLLADNGFSGTKATDITHADLDSSEDFDGEFSGGIYGPTGSEAAGVFDFDGKEAGAFRGAFGGAAQ